jgi:ribosomal protein S27AE
MTESLKEKADRLFRANPPTRVISIEEMRRSIFESREKLQKREKSNKRKPSTGEKGIEKLEKPCPECGMTHWNVFPDGRKMCLKCHYLDEKTDKITCEFLCSGCNEVIQAQGKDIEAAKKKIFPHKKYDPTSKCEGVFTYSRQIFPNPKPAPIPEIKKTERPSIEHGGGSGIIERFQHPKLQKFVCNKCPYSNDCLQAYEHTDTCIKISTDLKLRKMNELLDKLLQKLIKE